MSDFDGAASKTSFPLCDRFGRGLEPGRFIVYPGLRGRSAILHFGMIRSLHPDASYGRAKLGIYNEDGRKSNLLYPGRVIAVDDSLVPEGEAKSRLISLRPIAPLPLSVT